MSLSPQSMPFIYHFNASLPNVTRPVLITSLYDAQVFTRRWVIRDKDRALRGLLRRLERADGSERANAAIAELKTALMERGLFPGGGATSDHSETTEQH